MVRVVTKKAQKAKLDRLAGAMCRSRGKCEAAGLDIVNCNGVLQWAHIVGRNNMNLRWRWFNCLCLCAGHHMFYTYNPWAWYEFIENNFPIQYALIQAHRGIVWHKDYERSEKELEGWQQ